MQEKISFQIQKLEKLKAKREKELRILVTQKNQAINQDVVDRTARELELTYRTKEIEAMQAKMAFYVYTRSVIHAKRMRLE